MFDLRKELVALRMHYLYKPCVYGLTCFIKRIQYIARIMKTIHV